MNLRLFGFTILGIVILMGLIAGIFARSIERALTLPTPNMMQHTTGMNTGMQAPTTGANGTSKTGGAVPTQNPITQPTPVMMNAIAQDTFQRANQLLWGTASDGRAWESDANNPQNNAIFTITSGMAQIAHGQGSFNAVLGPVNANVEVLSSASVSRFGMSINFGVAARWTDTHNWYKALIDGTHLNIIKHVNDVPTQLATVPFTAQPGVFYTLRFRVIGAMLFAKAWPSNAPEPQQWMVTANDMSLTTGQGGMRVVILNDVVMHISSFAETVVNTTM